MTASLASPSRATQSQLSEKLKKLLQKAAQEDENQLRIIVKDVLGHEPTQPIPRSLQAQGKTKGDAIMLQDKGESSHKPIVKRKRNETFTPNKRPRSDKDLADPSQTQNELKNLKFPAEELHGSQMIANISDLMGRRTARP